MSALNSGPLRRVLEDAMDPGDSMADLTVLATQNDPYRVDTPAGHRDGAWLKEQFDQVFPDRDGRIHLRGLHYAIVSRADVLKPNGKPYRNDDADLTWLQRTASKAARWLGYLPFEAITDERNSPPIIHRRQAVGAPSTWVSAGLHVEIPNGGHLKPRVGVSGFERRQPYHVVIFGDKKLRDAIDELNNRLTITTERRFELRPISVPEPEIDPAAQPEPLVDSGWAWIEQTQALRARKSYLEGKEAQAA